MRSRAHKVRWTITAYDADVWTRSSVACVDATFLRFSIPTATVQSATCASRNPLSRGGSSVYNIHRDTRKQHVIDGGDDQSLEFFIHSNDEEIRRIHQDAVDVQK